MVSESPRLIDFLCLKPLVGNFGASVTMGEETISPHSSSSSSSSESESVEMKAKLAGLPFKLFVDGGGIDIGRGFLAAWAKLGGGSIGDLGAGLGNAGLNCPKLPKVEFIGRVKVFIKDPVSGGVLLKPEAACVAGDEAHPNCATGGGGGGFILTPESTESVELCSLGFDDERDLDLDRSRVTSFDNFLGTSTDSLAATFASSFTLFRFEPRIVANGTGGAFGSFQPKREPPLLVPPRLTCPLFRSSSIHLATVF